MSHDYDPEPASDPADVLKQVFGFDAFRPGQREVVDHLLAGRSAAAVFPTGGGKSLCYQLPAIMLASSSSPPGGGRVGESTNAAGVPSSDDPRNSSHPSPSPSRREGGANPGVTLVVSPLIALMKDQIDALTRRGIPARRLDSSLGLEDYRQTMHQLRNGRLRMLYVAPERFNNERFRETIRRLRVSLFAVDEAHCISEWGHNFRPDYLKLAGFAKSCGAERVLALTATATPKVLDDIRRVFEIDEDCAVRTGFYRPNLTLLMTPVSEPQRDGELLARLRERPAGPTIVYVTLQRTAEQVAEQLAKAGFDARAYHAGMEPDHRTAVQEWFLASDRGIVCATIAFGMGIDKANIRYVYHYNLPKSLENFSQEVGRAGRDGEPSICEMLVCTDDLPTLENFIYGDTPAPDAVRGFVSEIFTLGERDEVFDISLYELSRSYDVRPLVARTLLTYLELLGYLEGGTPFYANYRIKPLMSSGDILAKFQGERRDFLANLFRQARRVKVWLDLDVDRAASVLRTPRDRIVAALDYLDRQRMLEVQTAGVRLRYRRLKAPANVGELAKSLHQRTLDREKNEIARLNQVLDLVSCNGCQIASLANHFGEKMDRRCGHCSWCLRHAAPEERSDEGAGISASQAVTLPPRPRVKIDDKIWEDVAALRRQYEQVLMEPRVLARFLCGVSSPSLTKARLHKNALFGVLDHVPFETVLQAAREDPANDSAAG